MKLLLILILVFQGCAQNQVKKRNVEHDFFLRDLQEKRQSLSKEDYHRYLSARLTIKQDELSALQMDQDSENHRIGGLEVMAADPNDQHYNFQVEGSQYRLREIHQRIKTLETEISQIRAMMSAE